MLEINGTKIFDTPEEMRDFINTHPLKDFHAWDAIVNRRVKERRTQTDREVHPELFIEPPKRNVG